MRSDARARVRRSLAAIGTAATLAIALSSCAPGEFLDDPEVPPASPSATSSQLPDVTAEPSEPADEGEPQGDVGGLFDRESYADQVSERGNCNGRPARIDIPAGEVMQLTGDCPDVEVRSDGAIILLDDAERVAVSASNATVFVREAEEIVVRGDGNTVVWMDGRPDTDVQGSGNEVNRGR